MLLPFGCCLQAEVVHCVLDESGFSAVTVQPIVHAVEHALQILAVNSSMFRESAVRRL